MRLCAAAALVLVLAAGCGSDDEQEGEPIPAESAAALERQLDSIENRFEFGGGACADIAGGAEPDTAAVQSIVDSLPSDVDPDLRDALQQSFDRLFRMTEQQCDEEKGQDTEPEPPPETDTQTETIPTETLPEEDEEEPPPPEEEEPDEELPPGQDGELPPGQDGVNPGQGGGGGVLSPGGNE